MHDPRDDRDLVRFGVFELDLRARELRRHGRRVRIQDKPFEVLALLLERPGEVVTRDELRRRLWPADTFVVFDDSLNAAVRKAREALGDSADSPRFIETVPRHGYRFFAPVATNGLGSLADAVTVPAQPGEVDVPVPRRTGRLALTALLVGIALAGSAAVWAVMIAARPKDAGAEVVRFQIAPPANSHFPPGGPRLAISPDGRRVAFVAETEPRIGRRIWLQSLDSPTARPLAGTEHSFDVFWSPGGHELAFVSFGAIRRLDVEGHLSVPLGRADDSSGGAWSSDGGILVPGGRGAGLYRLSRDGGPRESITTLDAGLAEIQHQWPQFLPDGRSFIYLARSSRTELSGVYLARLGEHSRTRLLDTRYKAEFVAPDLLLFVRDTRLFAQRIDLSRAALLGAAVEIASDVYADDNGIAWFSASQNGALVYAGKPRYPQQQLIWLGRAGQHLGTVGGADRNVRVALSPDGRWAAVERNDPITNAPDIWLTDLTRGVTVKATTNPANDENPVWSPDSRAIVYARHRGFRQNSDLYVIDVNAPGEGRPLLVTDGQGEHSTDWSATADVVFYEQEGNDGKQDLWLLPLRGERRQRAWLATTFDERRASVSPSGRWVAYESDQTGRAEIFVRPLDEPARREWQISTKGGSEPKWRRDGRELYFVSADQQMMAADVTSDATFSADPPRVLFELRARAESAGLPSSYDVSSDGQRFLVTALVDGGADAPVTVILNWRRLLNDR